MEIISRKSAIQQDKTHYFTGKPCKRGHISARSVHSGNCTECASLYVKSKAKEWYLRYREGKKAREQTGDNRAKHQARIRVNNAIFTGKLVKQPCEVCGSTDKIHAHHDDYGKPLEVMWLCSQHHHDRHRLLKKLAIDALLTEGEAA